MLKTHKNTEGAFSLIELMLALFIGSILLITGIGLFSNSSRSSETNVHITRLNEQLQAAMYTMVNDIRRAGYWSNASTMLGTNANNNPFMAAGTDISINAAQNCILLSYDRNNDGTIPAVNSVSDDERYGFRLMNNSLQARPATGNFTCTAPANNWETISDPAITITGLNFVLSTTTTGKMQIRNITVTITGYHKANANYVRSLSQVVKVRNDKYVP